MSTWGKSCLIFCLEGNKNCVSHGSVNARGIFSLIKFHVCPIEGFQTNADRSRHIGLPSVPECFSRDAVDGNTSFASVARAGHNTDMTDTGKRARKTSGTQGSSLHDTGEKRSEQIVKHTCIRLDFRRSLVSGVRSSPRGRNAVSFTRTAAVNQWSLYYCPYMYLLQVLIGSLDCFSLSFVIGPSEYYFLERFSSVVKSKSKQ